MSDRQGGAQNLETDILETTLHPATYQQGRLWLSNLNFLCLTKTPSLLNRGKVSEWMWSRSVMSDSLRPHGL